MTPCPVEISNHFKMFLVDTYTCPILGPLTALFWISGNVSSWFQSQSGLPYIHNVDIHYLRSTSGATPADLFDGQLATSPVSHIPLPGLETTPLGRRPLY